MSVRVRLTRVGSKKNPVWRVVVADQRSPRDGRTIETLGHYNPQTEPSTIVIDRERLDHWIEQGAQPSDSVRKLMRAPNTSIPQPATADQSPAEPSTDEVAVAEAGEAEAHATEVSEVEASIEAEAAASDEATPESDAQVEGDADAAADDASS